MIRRLLLAAVVLSLLAQPAWAAVSEDDIEQAAQRLAESQDRADALTAEYEAGLAESVALGDRLGNLARLVQDLDIELGATRELVAERAVEIYMRAAGGQLGSLIVSSTLDDAGAGLGYLDVVAGDDLALIRGLEAQDTELTRQRSSLEVIRIEHDEAVARLEETARRLLLELEAAQTEFRALVDQRAAEEEARRQAEEAARRRAEAEAAAARAATSTTTTTVGEAATSTTTTPAGSSTTSITGDTTTTTLPPAASQTCPVAGPHTFSDTWGAPRSGGRSHQGVDMLAANGTELVAIEAGTIRRLGNSSLGGITVWLRGASGDEFYYAHLAGWAPGVFEGKAVAVGELLGYVGTTGNAPSHIPHLHFEYHPGAGGAVNPTPLVASLCR